MVEKINSFLKTEFNKKITTLVPKKPTNRNTNLYFWWRRFPAHKNLPISFSYKERLNNGDFDYSPYWKYIQYEYYWLAEEIITLRESHSGSTKSLLGKEREIITLYNKRLKKLYEDAQLDEQARIEDLKKELRKNFGGDKKHTDVFIKEAEGTLEELFLEYPKWLSLNK